MKSYIILVNWQGKPEHKILSWMMYCASKIWFLCMEITHSARQLRHTRSHRKALFFPLALPD